MRHTPRSTALGLLTLAGVLLAPGALARQPMQPETANLRLKAAAARQSWISTKDIGESADGRPIVAVHLNRGGTGAPWTVLLIGQQHGNEPAGMEALVALVDGISRSPIILGEDVDLWVVPMANPDGAAAGTRRNGADADLNRDHILLDQPETRALHALARRVAPHIVVDCHEFTRDSGDYLDRGWTEWPLITMDTANHPLLPEATYSVGLRWVELATEPMTELGYRYHRYLVGDAPPEGERRPSTLDGDDARNGLALGGSLAFIIESGVYRNVDDENADLDRRVAAYTTLLDLLLNDATLRHASRAAVVAMRTAPPPGLIPTNVLWGALDARPEPFPVISLASGQTEHVATHVMDTRVFKSFVPAPKAYAILPESHQPYLDLLDRHGLSWTRLEAERKVVAETCTLEAFEPDYDPVYHRYGGRQLIQRSSPAPTTLPAGTVLVPLDQEQAPRVAAILEPCHLFGLYQYERFRETAGADGVVPVLRVVSTKPDTM